METTQKAPQAADHTEDRRRQILRAAMTCFARRGFHLTTMNDISAEAQISVGLIYRYFDNKDAVITFMASEHLEDLRCVLDQARRAPTLFEALELVSIRHCEEQPEHLHVAFVADLFAEAARNEQVRVLVRDVTQFFIQSITDLIAASEEATTAPPGLTPRSAAEIIVDSTRGMMIRAIADSSTLTATQIRERQLAMLRTLWPLLFTHRTRGARRAGLAMKRKIAVALTGLLGVVGVLAGIKALQIRALIASGADFVVPAETISATEVKEETWESLVAAVGSIGAVQGVELRAELAGTVREIAFDSGATAVQGQVLVRLDTSFEHAQLRAAEAQAELARLNLERARGLKEQGVVSQADFDSSQAEFLRTGGDVDVIRATIAKKTIRAPFAGRLGIRSVNLGQYVHDGDPIVSLHSLDPVYVDFSIPEQQLAQIQRATEVRVSTDATPGRVFTGKVTALNPEVDPSTRNIKVQATVENGDGELRPGMFARVNLVLPEANPILAIPSTAVLHAPYGDSVFVINDVKDEKSGKTVKEAKMTTVRLGETRGDFIAVTAGLKAGQTVATSGVFKLRNGSRVALDNSLAPDAQSAPRPPNS